MKPFEFKLARLARVRKVQEELARAQWQSAERKAREADALHAHACESVGAAVADVRSIQFSPQIDPAQILQARRAIGFLEERRDARLELAQVAHEESARLREPWQVLRTELEGLRRLEEKGRINFRIESERAQAKETDQVAIERSRRPNFTLRRQGA